jgi:hypothetical protein
VSIGEALTKARTQAGLTVTQVSDQTRIRETIITGIEGDDFSACGGELYVRGYIRSIASAVGADPEPLIREYEAAQLGPPAGADEADEPVVPISRRERRLPGWITLGVVLALGLYFAAVHFLTGWPLATGAAPSARAHPVTHHSGHGKQATLLPDGERPRVAVAVRTSPGQRGRVRRLRPYSDNSDLARLATTQVPSRHGIPTGTAREPPARACCADGNRRRSQPPR